MPDAKISELTNAPSLNDIDEFAIATSGVSKKASFATIKSSLLSGSGLSVVGGRFWDVTIVRGTDKSVTSNSTIADDGVLQFNVLTNTMYWFEMFLLYNEPANSGTPDIKHDFALSTGSFSTAMRAHWGHSTTNAAQAATLADMSTVITNGANASMRVVHVEGFFLPSADATFKFRWAQNVSNGNAVVVYGPSVLRYRKMVV